MNRSNNISLGKASDNIIINEIKKLNGIIDIMEVKDSQQNRYNIQGFDKLQNDINMKLGIDYIIVMQTIGGTRTIYLDTKGFTYNPKYNGKLDNGVVETMLLQIEKKYSGTVYKGWANSPEHWTTNIIILLNNHLYYINYKKLMEYCNRLEHLEGIEHITFNKGYGNYEKCLIANVDDMKQHGVITRIAPISE